MRQQVAATALIAACTSCSAMSRLRLRSNCRVMTEAPAELHRRHLLEARHLAELAFQRRGDRRGHHIRAGAGQEASAPGWWDNRPPAAPTAAGSDSPTRPTSRMAIISSDVATGRRMKGAEGFMRVCRVAGFYGPPPPPPRRPPPPATPVWRFLQGGLAGIAETVAVLAKTHERVRAGLARRAQYFFRSSVQNFSALQPSWPGARARCVRRAAAPERRRDRLAAGATAFGKRRPRRHRATGRRHRRPPCRRASVPDRIGDVVAVLHASVTRALAHRLVGLHDEDEIAARQPRWTAATGTTFWLCSVFTSSRILTN